MKKIVLSILSTAFILIVSAQGVYGAEFDAVYYAQRYPDVANTVGCDEKALYNHYLTTGQYEGLYPNALEECAATAKALELQNAKATGNTAAVEDLMKSQAGALAATAAIDAGKTAVSALPAAADTQTFGLYGTYVDVNIANQTVTMFVNNLPVFSSPCVTGTPKNNRSTPVGAFYIMEKIPGKRLKGDTWDVWVDRWMKFTSDSCGLHDASWRKKFGGSIYRSNGSHGCVNLPKDKAYALYDMVIVGTPVIVH